MAAGPNIDEDVIIISDDDNGSDIRNHISETQETNDLDIAWKYNSELAGNNKIQIPLSNLSYTYKNWFGITKYKINFKLIVKVDREKCSDSESHVFWQGII